MFTMIGMQRSKKRNLQGETCLTEMTPEFWTVWVTLMVWTLADGRIKLAATLCEKAHCGKKKKKRNIKDSVLQLYSLMMEGVIILVKE